MFAPAAASTRHSCKPCMGHATQLACLLVLLSLAAPTLQQQPAAARASSDLHAAALLTCINSISGCFGNSALTTWEHMTTNRHSCLTARRAWWSAQEPTLSTTLVTQLSINRLQQLRAQCQAWQGPLAAAIYLPLLNPNPQLDPASTRKLQAAESDLQDLFEQSQASGSNCQLRLLLVYEQFRTDRAAAVLYPVNSLRNLARLMADTPLIANIDVDMLPSVSLSASLRGGGEGGGGSKEAAAPAHDYVGSCAEGKHVYVIPAFETSCEGPSYADAAVKRPKADLLAMIGKQCLTPFREAQAPAAHNITDYKRWFNATEPYSVPYATDYEPWFISARTATQWFDYRFRGYGKNKISQVAATAAAGSEFMIHPTGFIVHRYHAESQSRKAFLRVKFKSRQNTALLQGSLYQHVEQVWAEAQQQMANGTYQALVDPAVTACLEDLPWWKARRRRG